MILSFIKKNVFQWKICRRTEYIDTDTRTLYERLSQINLPKQIDRRSDKSFQFDQSLILVSKLWWFPCIPMSDNIISCILHNIRY